MEYNVLVLSAGRRVELVQMFQKASRRLGLKSKVIAADCSQTAPALYFSDKKYMIPRIQQPEYIDSLIDICKKENIRLVVPTIDTELSLLSTKKQFFEKETGAKLLISCEKSIHICRDKHNTMDFFEDNGIGCPKEITQQLLEKKQYSFPLFIKPRDGSASIQAFKVETEEELRFFLNYVKKPIVQQFAEGTEFSVDVFCDFDAKPVTIVPRVRLETRGGEVSKSRIVKDIEIIEEAKKILEKLPLIGHATMQCIKTESGAAFFEINPRFGGGAPMSIRAGADSCEYLYRLLCGEKLVYHEDYREGYTFLRFDDSVMLDEEMEPIR